MLALLGFAFAAGSLWRYTQQGGRGWLLLGAAALGLGLASGGKFLLGAAALLLVLVILRLTQPESVASLRAALAPLATHRWTLLGAVIVSTLLIATVAGLYPAGLGALVATWTGWLC